MSGKVVSETVSINRWEICVHLWGDAADDSPTTDNDDDDNKPLVVIYHGFLAHGRYPTVRYAAELLASTGEYRVVSADLPGHGKSSGLSGLLPPPDELIQVAVDIADWTLQRFGSQSSSSSSSSKVFFLGSSMGGTIALSVAKAMQARNSENSTTIAGVVLLAPMLRLSVGSVERTALQALTALPGVSAWQIIPSSSTNLEQQYRDPDKLRECDQDPYKNTTGKIRIGAAHTCVQLAHQTSSVDFAKSLRVPLLLLLAEEDVVVDIQGSLDLFDKATSQDKTLKRYPALHGLLCEPMPLLGTIQKDLLEWIQARK